MWLSLHKNRFNFVGAKAHPKYGSSGETRPEIHLCANGWERSENDFTILRDAISRPQPKWLKIIECGKIIFQLIKHKKPNR